ncbi:MAG TPA: TIM barrel protein [Acidobacteriota bacterium]|jgi:hydroxypyruvate isomerase|nr:TIM barrel protein [Acidobacteriota bacterium]
MDRRSFLGVATAGAAVATTFCSTEDATWAHAVPAALNRVRLSITWGMFRDMPIPEALAHLARLHYDGFEMFNWRKPEILEAIASEKKKYALECATLVGNKGVTAPGCSLVNPKERDSFLQEMNLAIDAAKKVDCKRLVTLTGNEVPGMSRAEMMDSCVAGLKAAAPMLEKNGITAVVEVLNTYVNHKGYFLYYVRDAAEMIDRVASPNVKILFDIYHVQIMEGNLIQNIRSNFQRIGHFHIGDVPGRHQPGTGEINYRNVFKAIRDLGYEGFAALEYSPTISLVENLAEMRKMTMFD